MPKDTPAPEQHLETTHRVLQVLGPQLWEDASHDPERFGHLLARVAAQVLAQHLAWVRESAQAGEVIPLVCSILEVNNPYTKEGRAYDLARIRIQPHVGKLQREQNLWIDLREPEGPQLALQAQRMVGQRCRIYQQVRLVTGPDGEPLLSDEGRPRQHHYVVRIEALEGQQAPAGPTPAPAAPPARSAAAAPAAPAPAARDGKSGPPGPTSARAGAPAAPPLRVLGPSDPPPPAPAAPGSEGLPPGYSSWDQARAARARVNALLTELRSLDEELYSRARAQMQQMGLAWPQPPDRVALLVRLLEEMRDEHLQGGAAVPLGGLGDDSLTDEQDPDEGELGDPEELPYEQDPDEGLEDHLVGGPGDQTASLESSEDDFWS
jgi:hypothetical protein